jgi:hypothetical protein
MAALTTLRRFAAGDDLEVRLNRARVSLKELL